MTVHGKAASAAALLIATTLAIGCPGLHTAIRPQWRKCERILSHPRIASLMIFGEGGGLCTVAIYENNGIGVMDGTRSGTLQNPFRCEELPSGSLVSVYEAIESLATGLSEGIPPPGQTRELLRVERTVDEGWSWGAVDELSPTELDAVRSIVCLTQDSLGQWAERAIRTVGPELTDRLGFPGTCDSLREKSRTERRAAS